MYIEIKKVMINKTHAKQRLKDGQSIFVYGKTEEMKKKDYIEIKGESSSYVDECPLNFLTNTRVKHFNKLKQDGLWIEKYDDGSVDFLIAIDYDCYRETIDKKQKLELIEFLSKPYDGRVVEMEDVIE